MSAGKKLTYTEYMTLLGLVQLAMETDKQMLAIVRAIAKVTGENLDQCDYGHASDIVYCPDGKNAVESVRIFLRKQDIVHETEEDE